MLWSALIVLAQVANWTGKCCNSSYSSRHWKHCRDQSCGDRRWPRTMVSTVSTPFFFVSWCLNCSSALASCLLLWLVTLCVWGFLFEGSGSWMAVGVVLFNVPVSCRDTHRDMWVAYAPIHIYVITWELTHADLQYKTESWKEVWEGEPVDKSPPKWIRHLYEQSVRRRRGYPTGELHP